MSTPFLFKVITMNQITRPSVHIFLIIFEGIPLIISLFQIPPKIRELSSTLIFSIHKLVSTTALTILVSIITLLVIMFLIIQLISMKTNKMQLTNSFCSNVLKYFILFCDLILFRYLSSIILLIYLDLIIECVSRELSVGLICFACLSSLIYIGAIYYHIYKTYIIIHVDNTEIIKQSILYSFDKYSCKFEIYMLSVKIVGAIENILASVNESRLVHYMPYFFSYLFIILIVYSFLQFIICDLWINGRVEFLLINTKFNMTRISLVLFYIYILALMLLCINDSVALSLISGSVIVLLAFIWTVASVIFLWNKIIMPQLYEGRVTIQKFAYVITRSHSSSSISSNENKKKTSCLYIDPFKILNSFKVHHFVHCVSDKQCSLCSLFYGNYINTMSYLNFYRSILKYRVINPQSDSDFFLLTILSLLYYKLNSKPYEYYSHYQRNLIEMKSINCKELFENYIDLLLASFLNINNYSNNVSLYNQITSMSSLNEMIHSTLGSMWEFVNLEEEHNKFKGIVQLSSKIVELDRKAQMAYKSTDNKGETDANEQSIKKIKNVYQYNTILNKYIVEKVLNKPINSTLPVEPEQLKDYFSLHFDNDSFLMLSMSSVDFNKESIANIFILKTGHSLIDSESKSFNTIIPSKLQYEANKLFIKLLKDYSEEYETNKSFDFIINDNKNQSVTSFRYQFDLLHLISDDSLLIYGFYSHPEKNIMLFESAQFDPNDLSLWRYNKSIQSLLFISIKVIDMAKDMNFYININELFTSIREIENKDNDNEDKNKESTENNITLECLFDYREYYKILKLLYNQFIMFYSSNQNEFSNELINAISLSKTKEIKEIQFNMKLLFEYNKIKAYSVNVLSNNYNYSNNQKLSMKESIIRGSKISQEDNNNNNDIVEFNNNLSTSSMADNHSINSLTSSINNRREDQIQLITLYNDSVSNILKDDRIKKRSWLIMKIVICLNIFIIALCILLLFIQIFQLNSLFSLNTLLLQFKQLRIVFTNVLLSIYSNVCIGTENSEDCVNTYIDYSRLLLLKSQDDSLIGNQQFYVNNYINEEIKQKSKVLISLFSQNKIALFSKGDKDLIEILNQQMNYSHIIYQNNQLSIEKYIYTFEQGLKNCFNSIQIIHSHPEFIKSHKLFILIYTGSSFDFSKVHPQKLDEVQIELYRLIINFLNFYNIFIKGEDILFNKIQHIKMLNGFILSFSIGTIFTFNFILFLFCLYEFTLVHDLLYGFCIEIITLSLNASVRAFFNNRIDNLLVINRLYEKNPNSLINDITKSEQIQQKRSKKLFQKTQTVLSFKNTSSTGNIHSNNDQNKLKQRTSSSSSEMSNEDSIHNLINPYSKISSFIFYFFFIFFIIFAYFTYSYFLTILNITNYVQLNYIFENNIYTSIGLMQIMSLLSLNDNDIAKELGYDPHTLPEPILNIKNREILSNLDMINRLGQNDPTNFPSIDSYFLNSSDCRSIIKQINDSYIYNLSIEKDVNYTKIVTAVCEMFNIASLPEFAFLYSDIMLKINNLENRLFNVSYEELKAFNNLNELFDLYTITLVIFRPLRTYMKSTVFPNRITKKMNAFITIVALFFSMNVLFTVGIFVINKWFIFMKLNLFNESLCSLKKSMLM